MEKEKKRDYKREYLRQKNNIVNIMVTMQSTQNQDIINQIGKRTAEGYSKQGYIKALIRYDIQYDILAAIDSNDSK